MFPSLAPETIAVPGVAGSSPGPSSVPGTPLFLSLCHEASGLVASRAYLCKRCPLPNQYETGPGGQAARCTGSPRQAVGLDSLHRALYLNSIPVSFLKG